MHKYVNGDLEPDSPKCGTVACIAGWTVAVEKGVACYVDYVEIPDVAQSLLGLDTDQSNTLFCGGDLDFPELWKPTSKQNLVAAIHARIDHFIESNGTE